MSSETPAVDSLRDQFERGEVDEMEVYDDDEPEDPDEEFLDYECGMMRDGQCTKAGSEECDWDCPRNR